MATRAEIREAEGQIPKKIIALLPEHFLETFTKRPTGEVAAGLRLLSQAEEMRCKGEAEAVVKAWSKATGITGDAAVERYNDELVVHVVACALTSCNKVEEPYFKHAAEAARVKLNSVGLRCVFDQLVDYKASVALVAPATDEELATLGAMLCEESPLSDLPPAESLAFRRWCRQILDRLAPLDL